MTTTQPTDEFHIDLTRPVSPGPLAEQRAEARRDIVHTTEIRRGPVQHVRYALCTCGWMSLGYFGDEQFAERAVTEECRAHELETAAVRP